MASESGIHDLTGVSDFSESYFLRSEADLSAFEDKVKPIIAAVVEEGDAALKRFAKAFDGVTVEDFSIRATEEEFDWAFTQVSEQLVEDLRFAIANIRVFHEAQKPEEMWWKEVRPGVWAGDRHVPIASVACYVPRGKGSFPSVVNMTTIPAVVAGVDRVVIITPPGPDGRVDAATLVAARLIGVSEVYKCGGAQGVAAVAHGTQSVPRCEKIVGPGSPWVVAAKRQLAGRIDPGVPAGPSEVLILADEHANPELAAMDLIIESEHGPDSSAWLVTNSRDVAERALASLEGHWAQMSEQRASFSRTVLTGPHGGIALVKDFDAAVEFTNRYAAEHLQLHVREPYAVLGRIRNAGEILLGEYTPTTLGNYVLGPNAVLPTGGAAKTAGPLSVDDYMKRISVGHVTAAGYEELAQVAHRLATYEGFSGHARAVSPARKALLERARP